ncbi:hypothetical protein [Dapis sp. BLCC M126]|uniref:hypothetical protein n=1 Tax=Dapis sp. BLCC M126 TaxID=3400189 RepID=UPI003CEF682A
MTKKQNIAIPILVRYKILANKQQEIGNRQQEIGNRQQEIDNREKDKSVSH